MITSKSVWLLAGNLVIIVALLALVWRLRLLVSWTLVALLLALAAEPLVHWLIRRRVKRGFAVLLVCIFTAGALGLFAARLVPLVLEQGEALIIRAPDLLEGLEQAKPIRWADKRFELLDHVQQGLRELRSEVAASAISVAGTIAQGVAGAVTIFTLAIFMLLFGDQVVESCLAWLAPQQRAHVRALGGRMRKMVGAYVLGALLVASVGGLVMAVTTLVLGVPYFLALGLLMIVFGLIPYLGSVLAAVLIVGVTLSSTGMRAALIAMGVYLIYQQLENHFLQPLVQRHTIQMNPLIITLSLLAGAMLAGVRGALLALPAAGAIQLLLQDAFARHRAQLLLGSRPPAVYDRRADSHGQTAPGARARALGARPVTARPWRALRKTVRGSAVSEGGANRPAPHAPGPKR